MAITEADLTQEIFEQYGMTSFPPVSAFKLLDSEEPELLVYSFSSVTPKIETKYYTREVYFALSPDNVNWFIYRSGVWVSVSGEDFYKQEFKASELASIPQTALMAKFGVDSHVYFRVAMISNKAGEKIQVTSVYANSVQSYLTGTDYVYSGDGMVIDTRLWTAIENCTVQCVEYNGSSLKIAFAVDESESWKVFRNGAWVPIKNSEVCTGGMSPSEVMALTEGQWDKLIGTQLRVIAGINSSVKDLASELRTIKFNYRAFENPTVSNTITLNTPEHMYERYILSDEKFIYEEFVVEGIGFDSPDELYNFYTTPNKIKLRVLSMGTIIGTKCSEVFKCVIVNTWDARDYNVSLTMKNGAGLAIPKEDYCLLRDGDTEADMTVGEMSFKAPPNFTAEYPLEMRLDAGERKTFYFRLTPNSTTIGAVQANIVATALQIG